MWHKEYRDYKVDDPLLKESVSPDTKSIIGCQMNELNGWGEENHIHRKKKRKGLTASLLERLFAWFT